jgi:hypothetical protein
MHQMILFVFGVKKSKINYLQTEKIKQKNYLYIKRNYKTDKLNIMKMLSEKKEKVQTFKRIYIVDLDITIFWITLISLCWILGYKLCLININPLFTDNYNTSANIAEITYSIFSSIIAASIFYMITIFIPRFNAINNMRKNIVTDIFFINNMIKSIIVNVNKGNSSIKYTFEEFIILMHCKQYPIEFEKAKKDFEIFFASENKSNKLKKIDGLKVTISYVKSYIEPIYQNYSNILPQVIIEQLNDFKYRNFDLTNLSEDNKTIYNHFFMQIVQTAMITNLFKIYYDLKE